MAKHKSEQLRDLLDRDSVTTEDRAGFPKWRTYLALVLVYVIVLLEQEWAWGILFLLWVIPDIRARQTYFIEPVAAAENPVLFWWIIATWLALCVLSFSSLFITLS